MGWWGFAKRQQLPTSKSLNYHSVRRSELRSASDAGDPEHQVHVQRQSGEEQDAVEIENHEAEEGDEQ
eukprot:9475033-Pyramimonas_sp.AAC.1